MRKCFDCKWGGNKHDKACPQINKEKRAIYKAGYEEGRAGKKDPTNNDPTFKLGFGEGVVALETYENSHQVWGRP